MAGNQRGRQAAAARRQGQAPGTDVEQRQAADPANTMRTMLDRMKPELALALPRHMTPDRMARQALTAFRTTDKLSECTPQSFLGALMTCAQVGLEPGPQGHVYLVPFWNRHHRSFEATFILGYRGIIELARRSGELEDIAAHTIYSNELEQGRFTVHYGSEPRIEHEPIVFGDRGEPVGYYATAKLKSGGRPFVVLSREDVESFRARSATQKAERPSGPWQTDYEAMAWKTCIRRLERWLPQSPELAAAVAHEDTTREHVPGQVVTDVLEQQPPRTGEDEPDDMGADPATGEIPAGAQQDAVQGAPKDGDVPEPGGPDDPWAQAPAGDEPPPDDPWADR